MATHGNISEFDADREDWVSYTERLSQYFIANGISEDAAERKRAILLSVCGASTYQLMWNLSAPAKPTEKSFAELVQLVRDHHQPPPSKIVQRFKFHTRVQKPEETVGQFIAELRKLSEHCEFGDTLDDMLRDRLVCGCKDSRLQCKLLAESDLTFERAFKQAKAMETAEQDSKGLQDKTRDMLSPAVHAVITQSAGKQGKKPRARLPRPTARMSPQPDCYRCGAKHKPSECKFREAECHFCKKKGHISKVCFAKNKNQKNTSRTNQLVSEEGEISCTQEYSMFHTRANNSKPIQVTVKLNGMDAIMEVDTGATLSVISEQTYKTLFNTTSAPRLEASTAQLKTYTGEEIKVVGRTTVEVSYKDQVKKLGLLVVAGTGPSLLGRNWLSQLQLDWSQINRILVSKAPACDEILDKHKTVFKNELGRVEGMTAKFHVNQDAQPKFFKARPVPYALRTKVEKELAILEADGVIQPVQFSRWAAPIVPVVKQDGSIRICGDYKVTLNLAAKTDSYPIPRIEDLFASLSGGKTFSKVDLASAYQQIVLDEESREYTTINTHKGLYQYTRLPFGVASAPAIFQRTIENILQGIKHVCVYLDDILVTGTTEEEHLHNLDQVLSKLENAGIRLKRNKCAFMLPAVEYLGHRISAQGLQPTQKKIQAIHNAPAPTNVGQLKSYLGLLNYYCKFLPNLSCTLAPLYRLLQNHVKWHWGPEEQEGFQKSKDALKSDCVLVHFDPKRDIVLACDASPYGIGAVLSHRLEDGKEKPIAFASRTLAPAEKKYSQLEKEGLAIIFGVKRFHQYLLGRHFTIVSDHKPLQRLFSESHVTPPLASARIQRWSLTLGAYDYSIQFKPGKDHTNADMLSRLPLPETPEVVPLPGETVLLLDMLNSLPVTAQQIRQWTNNDPVLSRVRNLLLRGWQCTSDEDLKPFQKRRDELSVQSGCVLWGSRVIVPPPGHSKVIRELHEGHPGATRMKMLARSFVWWPQIDKDIEDIVKTCDACQRSRHLPPTAPLQPWEWPQKPWVRLHADYAGPFLGQMFFIVVDAHSKWMEVKPTNTATTAATIHHLRSIFATHGLPEMLVTDNASIFTSEEFKLFTKQNGIRHVTSAPYHPASNGLAERAVQTFKEFMKKTSGDPINTRVLRFLFQYRITPHSTTGSSPAELLLGRRPRSRLDLLLPDISNQVHQKQQTQKENHDKHSRLRTLQVGDNVQVRDFPTGNGWVPGIIIKASGPLSFQIKLQEGRIVRRHIDHILAKPSCTVIPPGDWMSIPDVPTEDSPTQPTDTTSQPPLRRSTRISVPPKRYGQDNSKT